jgi:hypothetical protein
VPPLQYADDPQVFSEEGITLLLRISALLLVLMLSGTTTFPQTRSRNQSWLNGTWEGKGYQSDTDETWTMRLTVKGNKYLIEYPLSQLRWKMEASQPKLLDHPIPGGDNTGRRYLYEHGKRGNPTIESTANRLPLC